MRGPTLRLCQVGGCTGLMPQTGAVANVGHVEGKTMSVITLLLNHSRQWERGGEMDRRMEWQTGR